MKYRDELFALIIQDAWMLEVLKAVKTLKLEDCWVGAGFIRNKVWDVLHNYKRYTPGDVDVLYFDPDKCGKEYDLKIEAYLKVHHPKFDWSVKNQARMHIQNNHAPYKNCEDAIAHWPETATAVAVRLNDGHNLEIIAPYGLRDLFHLYLRQSPLSSASVFQKRLKEKQWVSKWPQLILK